MYLTSSPPWSDCPKFRWSSVTSSVGGFISRFFCLHESHWTPSAGVKQCQRGINDFASEGRLLFYVFADFTMFFFTFLLDSEVQSLLALVLVWRRTADTHMLPPWHMVLPASSFHRPSLSFTGGTIQSSTIWLCGPQTNKQQSIMLRRRRLCSVERRTRRKVPALSVANVSCTVCRQPRQTQRLHVWLIDSPARREGFLRNYRLCQTQSEPQGERKVDPATVQTRKKNKIK